MATGDLSYPAHLPDPQVDEVTAVDRAIKDPPINEGVGPYGAIAAERDRNKLQRLTWTLTAAQAEDWQDWWENTLLQGGMWFTANWPLPEGLVAATRRFLGDPGWGYIAGEFWTISALFWVRGLSVAPTVTPAPSAWNPLDMLSPIEDLGDPVPLMLTNGNRIYTRVFAAPDNGYEVYDAGVRGVKSHDGTEGLKRYFEIEVLSIGLTGNEPGDMTENQCWQFGMIDGTSQNVLQAPDNDNSEITGNGGGACVLCMGRFDGVVYHRLAGVIGSPTQSGFAGSSNPAAGDVYGFAWDIGTDVRIYRNGGLALTVPFTSVVAMFPYCSAGSVLVTGPNANGGSESFQLATGNRQFAHDPPTGYAAWG